MIRDELLNKVVLNNTREENEEKKKLVLLSQKRKEINKPDYKQTKKI